MNHTLILKLNATGDVVRTTALLRRLEGPVTWISARGNLQLLESLRPDMRCFAWEDRASALDSPYSLAVNLEDETETARFAAQAKPDRLFGAVLHDDGSVGYTDDACEWFDMSPISRDGRQQADVLKLRNRRSYQQMIFDGLGLGFSGERYMLPRPLSSNLRGDVALAPVAGPVWPMKNWAYYDALQRTLIDLGYTVNVLPKRSTLLEHLGDIANHRCLVGGDSLPMHLALGLGVPCVTLFSCTSPWEIHDYGLQTQIVSPLLSEFFYQRGINVRATTAIKLDEVLAAVTTRLSTSVAT